MTRIAVIGVPFHSGGRTDGVAGGIAALRQADLIGDLGALGHEILDRGDVPLPTPDPTRDPWTRVVDPAGLSTMVGRVADRVHHAIATGAFPLVIGGDCPILLGGLIGSGAQGLLHVDGHEDAYAPEQSPTGASADSEVAFALGLAPLSWDAELRRAQPLVRPGHLAIVGARDRPDLDRHGVASLGGTCFLRDDRQVAADATGVTRGAVDRLSSAPGGFWLHLDWDVLSNDEIGSVIFPRDGGVTWDDLATVILTALASPSCRGWSAGTYDPDLDPDGADAARIVAFVTRALDALDERPRTHGGSGAHG
jgi:arginase